MLRPAVGTARGRLIPFAAKFVLKIQSYIYFIQEDVNSHWVIKGSSEKDICKRGEPIECGQKIRLEHLTTHRNLHSHHFSSPLSNDQVRIKLFMFLCINSYLAKFGHKRTII